jgi:RimJ/RimL family protein N-acetyltransferase
MSRQVQTLAGRFVDLRPLAPDDAEITLQWRQGNRARYLNAGAASVEQQANWISSRPASEYNWIIQLKDGSPIGMLSLVDIDERNSRAETGRFLIGDEEKAKGVPAAVEAMGLVYDFAFNTLNLSRLHGMISADNTLMVKWQKYLGMIEEGRLREHYRTEDGVQDAVVLGILRAEYLSVFIPRARALMAMGRSA